MTMFELHFMILGSSGEGDAFMSSEFRQTWGRGVVWLIPMWVHLHVHLLSGMV